MCGGRSGERSEVDLSRGEQWEGPEGVGAGSHAQLKPVCSRDSRLVLPAMQASRPQSS